MDGPVWDVAVVGAGPAGAMAAHVAARAGASVVLLERASLPRYKTCGGGLIGTSQRLLAELGLAPEVSVRAATVTLGGRRAFTRRVDGATLLGMVVRDQLDAALAEAARAAGAELRQRSALRALRADGDLVRLDTTGGEVAARVVVGADGSASRVGGHVGVRCGQVDLGLEVELPVGAGTAGDWAGRILLDWGPLPGSYGWVFPKDGALTVGVIAGRGAGEATRSYLAEFVARLGLDGITPRVSSGHLTRCREPGSPLRKGRVLVVGDAAGLLEPFTREGISFALRSGRMAGEAAAKAAARAGEPEADGELAGYERAVGAELLPEMAAGTALLAAFSRHPLAFHAGLATPPGWAWFARFCRGQTTFARVVRHRWVSAGLAAMAATPGRAG